MVYVDDAGIVFRGKPRFHMRADSAAELHEFAAAIHVARCWWHRGSRFPHYDITSPQREWAIICGAQEVAFRDMPKHGYC